MKIPTHKCFDTPDERIENWYAQHGHDFPECLPYWVKYMPEDLRMYYLRKEGNMFIDYKQEMLSNEFDWVAWEHYWREN